MHRVLIRVLIRLSHTDRSHIGAHRVLIRLPGRLALPLEHAHQVGQGREVGAVDAHEGAIRNGDELMPRVAYVVYRGAAVEAAVRLGLEAG